MKIVCPHCSFSREVPDTQVPDRPVRVTCPQCQQAFAFDKTAALAADTVDAAFGEEPAAPAGEAAPPGRTVCPACGLEQPAGEACTGCGVIYARWAERQEQRREHQAGTAADLPDAAFPGRAAYTSAVLPVDFPKAGFWIRVAASSIDTAILFVVQFAMEMLIALAGGDLGELPVMMIGGLASIAVSLTYYIFFTGYNGQTPGKMALRIQVIRSDGTPMTYGRAFLREVLGKFASGIILGIGYLMVAFDRHKQGLHDKIAGTYVIKV
jgi:predicted Zn finger-like uncharacterized protein